VTIRLLFGPYGVPTSEGVDRFAAYGVNAVWFHGFNPQAFEACEASQLAACVEFKTFRADFSKYFWRRSKRLYWMVSAVLNLPVSGSII